MDHHEQHHEHHRKEREHEKELEKRREEAEMQKPRVIHPAWFVTLGVIGIVLVILVWSWL
jgi:hypothetical protein